MDIGMDKIGFFTPHLYLDTEELAKARNVDPEKFTIGIGQDKMAVAPLTQDPVTMAANAAREFLDDADRQCIDFVMFATESAIDHSKSAAIHVHHLLGLDPGARCIDMKQACYGATAAIQMAKGHIACHPDKKVLVLGADIAEYGLETGGEVTQGAGAVAMLIGKNPKIMSLENHSEYMTEDISDFFRPVYASTPVVDGKFSNEQYISFFSRIWEAYKAQTGMTLDDFAAICFHLPYTKMGWKALRSILHEGSETTQKRLYDHFHKSISYNRDVGNIYTGSLYLSLLSLLDSQELSAGERIGFFSYGSGAVGEFFSGLLQEDYQIHLYPQQHETLLSSRDALDMGTYEQILTSSLPEDGSSAKLDTGQDPAPIVLAGLSEHKRHYINRD